MTEYLYRQSSPTVQDGLLPGVPNLIFQASAWEKLMGFVLACPLEINGFGYVRRYGLDVWVDDVFILPQVVSAGHAETDSAAVAKHITEMLNRGEDPSIMKLQWHSHVNMPAYFSGIDLDTIDAYSAPWMTSLVVNKQGEYQARLDVYGEWRFTTPLQVHVARTIPDPIAASCQAAIDTHVQKLGGLTGRRRKPIESTAPGSYIDPSTASRYS